MISERKIRKNYAKLRPIYQELGLSVAGDVPAMRQIAKYEATLRKHAELACNEPLSETQVKHHERYAERALAELKAMLPAVASYLMVNGDPRGYALKIDPYADDPKGMKKTEFVERILLDSRITTDWGGYGILDPEAQLS